MRAKLNTREGPKLAFLFKERSGEFMSFFLEQKALAENGFYNYPAISFTLEGKPYFTHRGHLFYLTPFIPGRKVDYQDVHELASLLALYYNIAGKRGAGEKQIIISAELARFKWGRERLDYYLDLAANTAEVDPFDRIYLQFGQQYLTDCFSALEFLEKAAALRGRKKEDKCYYLRLVPENLVKTEWGDLWIQLLENSGGISKAEGLAEVLKYFLTVGWRWGITFLESYSRLDNLSPQDIMLILAYLFYPGRFISLAQDHYERGIDNLSELEATVDLFQRNYDYRELLVDYYRHRLGDDLNKGGAAMDNQKRKFDLAKDNWGRVKDPEEKLREKQFLSWLVRSEETITDSEEELKVNWPPRLNREVKYPVSTVSKIDLMELQKKVEKTAQMASAIEDLVNKRAELIETAEKASGKKVTKDEEELVLSSRAEKVEGTPEIKKPELIPEGREGGLAQETKKIKLPAALEAREGEVELPREVMKTAPEIERKAEGAPDVEKRQKEAPKTIVWKAFPKGL
jgi:hypothetical protein